MNTLKLPASYVPIRKIDFQKNKKLALTVNLLSILLLILTIWIGNFIIPLRAVLTHSGVLLLTTGTGCIGLAAYLILHELIHGIFMKVFGGTKLNYGFTGLYAYASCNAFFDKKSYFIISLAPVVLWGLCLTIASLFVPSWLFWGIHLIQAANISSSVGDIYVALVLLRMPKETLTYDFGTKMFLYAPKEQ